MKKKKKAMNNIKLNVVGWRDPAYLASSSEGFAYYGKAHTIKACIDDDNLNELLNTGFIVINGDSICIDYEEVNSTVDGDTLVFDDCILFIPTFAFDDNDYADEYEDEGDFFEDFDN